MGSVYHEIPTTYAGAIDALGGRSDRKIGYATALQDRRDDDGSVEIWHHGTPIVRFLPDDSVRVTSGGFYSATTKARINAALSASPWGVYSERGKWFWHRRGYESVPFCEFVDGDRVYLCPALPGRDGIFS